MKENTDSGEKEQRTSAYLFLLLILVADLFMDHAAKWLTGKGKTA
jgi:hypothetical protein